LELAVDAGRNACRRSQRGASKLLGQYYNGKTSRR
jgi:hypothetical protein